MKKMIKKLSDVMNYKEWYHKLILVLAISIVMIVGVLAMDILIDTIRLLFNIEWFAFLSPVFAIVFLLYCQVKYPKDKTKTYSQYAKDRM